MMIKTMRTVLLGTTIAVPGSTLAMTEDDPILIMVKADQFEVRDSDEGDLSAWEGHIWIGRDLNKVWLKSEGERLDNESESIETQLLFSHALDANWDFQLGFRHDSIPKPDRDWAVFGFNGIAPYWIEIDTALFIGEDDLYALRFEAEYELLLSQKWELVPEIEINWYGEDDDELGIASGFSELEAGIRLHYVITPQFAPYIGFNYEKLLGDTSNIAEDADEETSETQLVAGVKFWF